MESPLIYDELEDVELKAQFKDMMGDSGSEEEVLAFLERVRLKVTANPILARIVENEISLLDFTLMITDENYAFDDEAYVPTIKCLIDANPAALLWRMHYELPIHLIASQSSLYSLVPWIAANHQWVLDHESIIDDPPVFELIELYKNSRLFGATNSIDIAEAIRQFIELYPRSLDQKDSKGFSPLHNMVRTRNVDLVKRMVELCPSSMRSKTNSGLTPLHIVCACLTKGVGDDLKEICLHLISECPESVSVRRASIDFVLPIHILLGMCQHQVVREVIVCMLRAYPESYDIQIRGRAPSSIPFIQHVNSLLVEERALQVNIDQLQLIPGAFDNAVECTRDDLIKSISTVFNSWTKSSIQAMESKIELNSSLIQHACEYFIDGYPDESVDGYPDESVDELLFDLN